MEEFLQELKMPDLAKRLWNVDYTGFCTAVASQRVLAKCGAQDVHETAGGEWQGLQSGVGGGLIVIFQA